MVVFDIITYNIKKDIYSRLWKNYSLPRMTNRTSLWSDSSHHSTGFLCLFYFIIKYLFTILRYIYILYSVWFFNAYASNFCKGYALHYAFKGQSSRILVHVCKLIINSTKYKRLCFDKEMTWYVSKVHIQRFSSGIAIKIINFLKYKK